ncbi:beta-ketoacyl-[acyl-carrier-protein] synthase family protein [Planktomarina sp.]|nr:beta-ketoacyl-[acyl-carrier-protein] synthase family protein [Planktomarina sp.]MDC0633826.1 beta-ketoacyl-[acyl-carrier-protein] synthase family protein [Planktomarina sp.]
MNRVVITGSGTVNALGTDVRETLLSMQEGKCGIGPLKFRDVDRLSIKIGAQIKGYTETDYFNRQELVLYDRVTQFAILAARQAVNESGLIFDGELSENSGVLLGTAAGGMNTWEDNYRAVFESGKNRVHPFVVPKLMNNAATSHVSMEFNLKGPSFTVSTACASSNHAIGLAFQMVRSGMVDVMIAGGSEAMLTFGGLKAWEGLRVMSKDACRPFSDNRSGMVQGEGAGIFILEKYENAISRGANILAEIVGFAMNSDASDIVVPSQDGASTAMIRALKDARMDINDVGYINAHGTGTRANDTTECAAITKVFGAHVKKLMVSSTKSMHGHLIGGTGAVELLACIMAIRDGIIAPTIGYEQKDTSCDIDVVPNIARNAKVKGVVSNAFAFGGMNAVLVMRPV